MYLTSFIFHSLLKGDTSSILCNYEADDELFILMFYRGICVAAYHLYSKRNTLKNGEKGKATIAMQRFDKGCKNPWCGPNFCCCKA